MSATMEGTAMDWSIINELVTDFLTDLNDKVIKPYKASSIDVYVFPQITFMYNDFFVLQVITLIHEQADIAQVCINDPKGEKYLLTELHGLSQLFYEHLHMHRFDYDDASQYLKEDDNERIS